jgi:glucosamine 6-phosphate synthetase-like amidotransferase/phosphosugar isomerase protein
MNRSESIYDQVVSVPSLIRETLPKIKTAAENLFSPGEIAGLRRLVLSGSGDSCNAAFSALMAFQQLGRIEASAHPLLEVSRYMAGVYIRPPASDTLFIGISMSGTPSRGAEAAAAMAGAGCRTVALTGNPGSPLGKSSGAVFPIEVPPFPQLSPGVRNFAASLLGLYVLALVFGRERGALSAAEVPLLLDELAGAASVLERSLKANKEKLAAFAEQISQFKSLELLASGPSRGAADFGLAKLIETAGFSALTVDVEEYNHLNYFRSDPRSIPTVLICPEGGRAAVRCEEISRSLTLLERPYIILTGNEGFEDHGEKAVRVSGGIRECFSPLVYSMMLALTVSLVDRGEGTEDYRGHKGPWDESQFKSIWDSRIVTDL